MEAHEGGLWGDALDAVERDMARRSGTEHSTGSTVMIREDGEALQLLSTAEYMGECPGLASNLPAAFAENKLRDVAERSTSVVLTLSGSPMRRAERDGDDGSGE